MVIICEKWAIGLINQNILTWSQNKALAASRKAKLAFYNSLKLADTQFQCDT